MKEQKNLPSRTRSFKTDVLKVTPTATYGPFKGGHLLTSFVKLSLARAMNKAIKNSPEFKLAITPFDQSLLSEEELQELSQKRKELLKLVQEDALSTDSIEAAVKILEISRGIDLAQVIHFNRDAQLFKVPVFMNTGEYDRTNKRPIESMVICTVMFYEKEVHEVNRLHLVEAERDLEWETLKKSCLKSEGKDSDTILIKSIRLQYQTETGEKTLFLKKVPLETTSKIPKKVQAALNNQLFDYFVEQLPSVIKFYLSYIDAKGLRNKGIARTALQNPQSKSRAILISNLVDSMSRVVRKRKMKRRMKALQKKLSALETRIQSKLSSQEREQVQKELSDALTEHHAIKRAYYGK